jgi:carboxyl-terminal processing protease
MIRRAAAITLLVACAACGAVVGPDIATNPLTLFDQVWGDFDLHYSLFVVKQINWDSLRASYRPLAATAVNEFALENIVSAMLSNLHDGHVLFRGLSVGAPLHGNSISPTITYGKYVSLIGDFSDGVSYGRASSGVGYIQISTFEGSDLVADVDSALSVLRGSLAIIIDVRNNDGGLLDNATNAAGRFATQRTTVAYVRYRDGPAHTDFTKYLEQQVLPAGRFQYAGDVYVLTSRNTVSAAELFVLAMQALGRTTVVGDTTAGESGSPFARELQNGWSYQFPESIEYTLAGTTYEDIGLAPDAPVKNTNRQIQSNIDAQMALAISLASQPSERRQRAGPNGRSPSPF